MPPSSIARGERIYLAPDEHGREVRRPKKKNAFRKLYASETKAIRRAANLTCRASKQQQQWCAPKAGDRGSTFYHKTLIVRRVQRVQAVRRLRAFFKNTYTVVICGRCRSFVNNAWCRYIYCVAHSSFPRFQVCWLFHPYIVRASCPWLTTCSNYGWSINNVDWPEEMQHIYSTSEYGYRRSIPKEFSYRFSVQLYDYFEQKHKTLTWRLEPTTQIVTFKSYYS